MQRCAPAQMSWLCLQGGGPLQIGDLQFMVAGEEDGMMIKGALPKGTVRE